MSEIIQSFELFEAVHLQGKMVRKISRKTTNKRTSPLTRPYFCGGTTGHLDLLQLQIHGSDLSRSKLLPEEWAKVVARASLMPGCATHEEVLMRWRAWQLDPILHAAARIDFEQHVKALLATGRRNEAEVLQKSLSSKCNTNQRLKHLQVAEAMLLNAAANSGQDVRDLLQANAMPVTVVKVGVMAAVCMRFATHGYHGLHRAWMRTMHE